MSVREYVGARYVPVFADPLEWDNTRTYEPLTIVYYQGNSYTSRQAVPVGIPITNENFWVITGNYNAQIEAYRAEVQTFDGRIDTLEDDLPISAFSSHNTVKAYIDAIKNAIQAIIPASSFSAQNTVKDYIDNQDNVNKTRQDNRLITLDYTDFTYPQSPGVTSATRLYGTYDTIGKVLTLSGAIVFSEPLTGSHVTIATLPNTVDAVNGTVGYYSHAIACNGSSPWNLYNGSPKLVDIEITGRNVVLAATTLPDSNVTGIFFQGDTFPLRRGLVTS